jgi:hypothetical protein
MHAREVVNNVANEYMLQYDADDEVEEEGVHFVALELADDLPRDRRIVLERRNALIPPMGDEVSALELPTAFTLPNARLQMAGANDEPPPRYTREPAAPRRVSDWAGRDSEHTLTVTSRMSRDLGLFTQSR